MSLISGVMAAIGLHGHSVCESRGGYVHLPQSQTAALGAILLVLLVLLVLVLASTTTNTT
eukprot:1359346-Rhodomonas_salina.3